MEGQTHLKFRSEQNWPFPIPGNWAETITHSWQFQQTQSKAATEVWPELESKDLCSDPSMRLAYYFISLSERHNFLNVK